MSRFQNLCFQPTCAVVLAAALLSFPFRPSFAAEDGPVTIAMTAAFVSEKGTGVYEKISNYLHQKTGIEMNFLTGLSYSTVNSMVENGAADIAFVCGYP